MLIFTIDRTWYAHFLLVMNVTACTLVRAAADADAESC